MPPKQKLIHKRKLQRRGGKKLRDRGSKIGKGETFGVNAPGASKRTRGVIDHREAVFVNAFMENGGDAGKAYQAVKPGRRCPSAAWAYMKRPTVRALIAERMRAGTLRAELTVDKVIRLVLNTAESSIKDFGTWNKRGFILNSSDEITREQAQCIKKIVSRPSQYGPHVTIELYDAESARRTLLQFLGVLGGDGKGGQTSAGERASQIRAYLKAADATVAVPIPATEPEKTEGDKTCPAIV